MRVTKRPHGLRGGLAALAAAALILAPAIAWADDSDTITPVGTIEEFRDALNPAICPTEGIAIALTAAVASPGERFTTSCDTVIDLRGHDLSTAAFQIGSGLALVVRDSSTPDAAGWGTFTVLETALNYPGIGTYDATLVVESGKISATSGVYGAGIGGASGQNGGTVIIEGGHVASLGRAAAGIGGGLEGAGGVVTVTGGVVDAVGNTYAAGIGGGWKGDSALVTITGGKVNATGAGYGAGIGGGEGGDNLGFVMTGGEVVATGGPYAPGIGGGEASGVSGVIGGSGGVITIDAGTVIARGGEGAVGIGGGSARGSAPTPGAGAALFIGEHATVITSSIGGGTSSGARGEFGLLVIDGVLHLETPTIVNADTDTTIPEIVISETGRLLGTLADPTAGGALLGDGEICNEGVIALTVVEPHVCGNDFEVTFDRQGGTTPEAVRVLAPSFDTGYRTLPAAGPGAGWNTASDGTGAWFTASTPLASDQTLYRAFFADPLLAPIADTAAAGEGITYTVTGEDGSGSAVDIPVTITSDVADDVIDGQTVTATTLGERTITATGEGISLQTTLTVNPAAVDVLTLTAPTTTVDEGGSVTFEISGTDAYGNAVDTSGVVLTSSVSTDVVDGLTVHFPTASPHVITATLGTVSTSVTIEVVAAAPEPVPAPDPASPAEPLPGTGADGATAAALAAGGGLVVVAGALLVWRRRRA